ncbi:MAG: LPS assembly lipoprotein LptE [Sulfuricurvum sp.]|uniref:LPS assembly lipoprotein LptE n=1 Tax=Sulfuricurvum sp. TaxID=2025608 RepID=UPI00262805B9|nr:LPS assembly lipoprotein LptE [Sulfuricurvum sp.]MDD2829177.1 LPS assembly lipoprotein LptE [Sulfuricurvum sp.]MDD4949010.1 LPS assembly lipoprotein LptE [Sulfuricurvum sp.]
MKLVLALALALMISGCGYAPASHYAKNVVGESVSTEVVISMEDPQNTVIIKDAVDIAVITKFRTALVGKESSKTHLKFSITSVGFSPLRYDTNGYVITYRTTVSMGVGRTSLNTNENYHVSGMYDFDIKPNAIISDQARFEAIRQASQKGIDNFIAQVAAQGSRGESK